jgi:hypothetical protein
MALEISNHIKQARIGIIQDAVMLQCSLFSAPLDVFICIVFDLLDQILLEIVMGQVGVNVTIFPRPSCYFIIC